ncbi:MAG: 2-oxo acid dehydrogenase subunit E2 [Oscillospiraceae bacterium]|jgi:pyruvate dehydrogenase E2 component (dihydrolipoamide acetyltransferase)|nr:2-oxo acid dehydrogenase subunit E2 [Oscillospiraceae bacterium]
MSQKSNRKLRRTGVEHFGIQRKIVANMTTESWETIPHAGANYEPDVTEFWNLFQSLRKEPEWSGITINTLMLYVITQGLKACPALNGHISFRRKSANGRVETISDIDISIPMALPIGGMMTINIHNCERMRLRELSAYIGDVRRRMEKTDFNEAMFSAALENTVRLLAKGKIDVIARRLIGNTVGKGKMPRLNRGEKKAYLAIPESERLTKRDIEQGTITVSNFGSVYRASYVTPLMLEIIPPQICAIAIGGMTERPGVAAGSDGVKAMSIRKYMSFCIMFDHRALDYEDTVHFMEYLDGVFAHPEVMLEWL